MRTRSVLALLIACAPAFAYTEPVVTAGPLTVAMLPPAVGAYGAGGYVQLSRPGVPLNVLVSIRNSSGREVSGKLRVAVIDDWKLLSPDTVPFRIEPHGDENYEFTMTFGPNTYNAHYPVHAYAEFEDGGQKYTAHPILILQTSIPDRPRPKLPAEWKPVPVPAGGTLGLWRTPVRRESADVVNVGAEAGQAGREEFEAAQWVTYGDGIVMMLGKRAPSNRETVEAVSVEYPLALPAVKPVRLEFETSGGASFRIEAAPFAGGAPQTVFEARAGGGPASVNLDRYAGTNIRLRFEARGAAGEARWTQPTITAGNAPRSPAFPPTGASKSLGTAAGCEIRLWPGSRGMLDAPVGFLCGDRKTYFRGFRVRVGGDALEDWRSATELVKATEEPASGRHRVRHNFRNWAGTFDVLSELWVDRDALRARFWIENAPAPQPWFAVYLEGVSPGAWSDKAVRIYGGPGNVIQAPQAFRLGFDGHSLASSFVGFDFANGQALVQNSDAMPDYLEVDPAQRIYSLVTPHDQTLEIFPAENVFAAVKRIRDQDTRKASGGVKNLAGRFVFDLWSGRYGESARALNRAAEYGISNSVVVWHNWQRWGYDYRLPDVYPPNPEFGTFDEFRSLVAACKRQGTYFAPHDNYIDFYPDATGFTYKSIVFNQNGTPHRAWFHYYRGAQSYRSRPDQLMPYVQRNVGLEKEGFGPTAYFIDVWSSMAPYDYWTNDGKFVDRSVTQKAWGGVFAWIRGALGNDAPQISEAGHDKLIGWLDGAQANQLRVDANARNFTWKIKCADSERIPWIDVAWHEKFILHGAGYPDRYAGGLGEKEHGAYSDDYIATEVLSGRPAMVPQPFNRDVVRVYWLLNDAMRALALDRVADVQFAGGNIHRQHVRWERGAQVWVNRGQEPWTVEGHTLPQYGFYLHAGDTEAAIETKNGRRVEWSKSPGGTYENGRMTTAAGKTIDLPRE